MQIDCIRENKESHQAKKTFVTKQFSYEKIKEDVKVKKQLKVNRLHTRKKRKTSG